MVFKSNEPPEKGITNPVQWLRIGIFGLLLGAMYYSALSWLVTRDWPRDDYTHCFLIPFIVIYLIWEKRQSLATIPSVASWAGFGSLVLGLSLFWLGELSGELFALYLSSWLFLLGIIWALIGWEKLKIILFPICLLLAAFPLPHFVNNKVTVGLKLVSSQLGVAMMRLYGMSAFREGNVIDLGFTQLQVVDACSGLRYLFPLIVLGIILAYLFKASFWKRAAVVISTVPLSIITNSLRIALTGILYEIWGAEVAEGFFHGFSGWFIFMFSFVVLLGEMKVLGFKFSASGKKEPSKGISPPVSRSSNLDQQEGFSAAGVASSGALLKPSEAGANEGAPKGFQAAPQAQRSTTGITALLRPPQFVVAVILLGGTLALSQGVEFREKVPMTRPLSEFPAHLGQWRGTRQSMEQKFIDTLDFSDYAIMDYRNGTGKDVNFYVAYYESQRKGESIHSPETCLPGSGWVFNQAGVVKVPMPGTEEGFMTVNRAFIQKGAYKQLSYFWFAQRGRILTNAYQLKIFAFWDALTKQRTDGALVRLITPVYENEPLDQADARLQGFAKEIVPVLDQFIPGK